jgi:hypothetical protein
MQPYIIGRNIVVGIMNRYGLDDMGFDSKWGDIFRTCPDRS